MGAAYVRMNCVYDCVCGKMLSLVFPQGNGTVPVRALVCLPLSCVGNSRLTWVSDSDLSCLHTAQHRGTQRYGAPGL